MLTIARLVVGLLLIALGIAGYQALSSMKKPPDAADTKELVYPVQGFRLKADDLTVTLKGYGTARSRTRVAISSELAGLVTWIHPRLEAGEVIPEGETLFKVDHRTYSLRRAQAEADIERLVAQIERITRQQENDNRRLELSRRTCALAKSEYERIKNLFEKDAVGSLSGVELAEKAFIQAQDQVTALENALVLYPVQIQETGAAIKAAEVARDAADLDLERSEVKAPFTARLETVSLEKNQVVSPGQTILTIVDDAVMEVPVSLDSREMSLWFPFSKADPSVPDGSGTEMKNWFAPLPGDMEVRITWLDNPEAFSWTGRLVRVERFSAQTATTTVVAEVANLSGNGPALAEGMFCCIEIPGRTAHDVYAVPAVAVSHEKTVHLARNDRLRTQPVEVVHKMRDYFFIRGDFEENDIVITTRLETPTEGILLKVTLPGEDPSGKSGIGDDPSAEPAEQGS